MKYTFVNPYGFDCDLDSRRTERENKPIYHVKMHNKPLMIHDALTHMTYLLHDRYSDLASVPRAIQVIWGMEAWRWKRSAIVHDEIYRHGALCTKNGGIVHFTRADADSILYELIKVEGDLIGKKALSFVTAPLYWVGVRGFGWLSFLKKEKII